MTDRSKTGRLEVGTPRFNAWVSASEGASSHRITLVLKVAAMFCSAKPAGVLPFPNVKIATKTLAKRSAMILQIWKD